MEFGLEPSYVVRQPQHTSHAPRRTQPAWVKHTSSTLRHTSSWDRRVDKGGTHTSQRVEISQNDRRDRDEAHQHGATRPIGTTAQNDRRDRVEAHQHGATRPIETTAQNDPPSERYIDTFFRELGVNHSATLTKPRKPPPVPPKKFKGQIVENPRVTNDFDPPLKAKQLQVPKIVASGKNLAFGKDPSGRLFAQRKLKVSRTSTFKGQPPPIIRPLPSISSSSSSSDRNVRQRAQRPGRR